MTYRDRLLTCPRCGSMLEHRTRRESWPCQACGGVAVEVGELIRLLHGVAPDLLAHRGADSFETPPRISLDPPVICAACGQPTKPVIFHGVELDRCLKDELVWFDPTELDRVLDAAIAAHEARKSWIEKLRDLLYAN